MHRGGYDRRVRWVRDLGNGNLRVYLEVEIRRVHCRDCRKVKREQLEFLADNPFYTKRFAYYVGRRCRSASIKDIAEELHLHWGTVKELDKQYMRAQLARGGAPGPRPLVSTRSRSASATSTASLSAISSVAVRSGSAARTARKRV